MKPHSNPANRPRRPRRASNNNRRHNNNNNPNKHWESLGPNVRIRGSAHQIYDKYVALASDAKRNGDRVLVENLMQHAEHYLRIMNRQQLQRQARQQAQESEKAEQANDETLEDDANTESEEVVDTEAAITEEADKGDASSEDAEDNGAIVEDLTPKPQLENTEADEVV